MDRPQKKWEKENQREYEQVLVRLNDIDEKKRARVGVPVCEDGKHPTLQCPQYCPKKKICFNVL
jgi:hypothetical protein